MNYLIQEFCCIVSKPLSSTNRHINSMRGSRKKNVQGEGDNCVFQAYFCINLPSEFNNGDAPSTPPLDPRMNNIQYYVN